MKRLKKTLQQHRPKGIFSFFYSSPAIALSEKLQFDFHSLITALDTYSANFAKWNEHRQEEAWIKVGKAQRDVPACIAHAICRSDVKFPSSFNEETLPRELSITNSITNDNLWFPLTSSSSGLGYDYALMRANPILGNIVCAVGGIGPGPAASHVTALRDLDEVRITDLTLSRENLSRHIRPGLVY